MVDKEFPMRSDRGVMFSKSNAGNKIIILSISVAAVLLITGVVGFRGIESESVRIVFTLLIVISALLTLMQGLLAARHFNKWFMQYAEALQKGADCDLTERVAADSGEELPPPRPTGAPISMP
jgi:type VI protein secretion system component VasK